MLLYSGLINYLKEESSRVAIRKPHLNIFIICTQCIKKTNPVVKSADNSKHDRTDGKNSWAEN